jgi:pyruvate carboxylase
MSFKGVLVANRGEIAVRIIRAANDLNLRTVAVFSEDESASLHTKMADETYELNGRGVPAYLDMDGIIKAAKSTGCDGIHPGYGFLAENADFARRCMKEGIVFIGPKVENLELFGDKAQARAAAARAEVPILRGIDRAVSLEEAKGFFASLGPNAAMMLKAVAGGGGRGSRTVTEEDQIEDVYDLCQSEALHALGNGDLYVEEFIKQARHIEVQILGDCQGNIIHLGERECSVQRRHQKIIEVAPAPHFPDRLRSEIIDAALRLAKSVGYFNLGTFEFLFNTVDSDVENAFSFIEVNARLQVEHTVTEAVTGVDIVQTQIQLAGGSSLAELGLDDPILAKPRGYAIQARVNMETLTEDGTVRPGGGTLRSYEAPNGPGVRTDGFGYAGYTTSPSFDSLLAKVIAHSPSARFEDAAQRSIRALSEFRIEGVDTNIPFLHNVLEHADFTKGAIHTRWVDENIEQLARADATNTPRRWMESAVTPEEPGGPLKQASPITGTAPVRVDTSDPLALFDYDRQVKETQSLSEENQIGSAKLTGPDGSIPLPAPIQGTIVKIAVSEGMPSKPSEPGSF